MDLKRKVGPLPLYAWMGITTVIVLSAYLYLRKGQGPTHADETGDTGVSTGGVLDPTNGQPYAGSVGDTGSSLAGGPIMPPAPDLTNELSDVAGLIGQLSGLGLINTGYSQQQVPDTPGYDDIGVVTALHDLQASLQQGTNHDPPPKVGDRGATIFRPSAEHGGQLWEYRTGQRGKLVPVGKAPKGAKATSKAAAHSGSSTSGAKSAPKSGASSSSGTKVVSVKGHGQRVVGSTVYVGTKTYKVNSNGTLRRA